MKISSSSPCVLGALAVCAVALLSSPVMSHRARAFGGFWSSEAAKVSSSAERIIFVDNPDSTVTAIIQIKYAGPPQRFAWVIPMPGTPTVGVSSSTVFQRLDAATAPQYWVEVTLEGLCMQQDDPKTAPDASAGAGGAPSLPGSTAAPVVVLDQGTVGSYDYVDVTIDPSLGDPARVATDWLTMNGYDLTSLESKVLSPYLRDGLNLLAFKLASGADVGAIRPVTLTYESELPMIPIRPTALAAQDDMGIQVWVIGPSQAVPDNYKSLVINDARIDWLTGRSYAAGTLPAGGAGPVDPNSYVSSKPSNYDAVVAAAADEAGGQGFVTELGAPASQFREKVWSAMDDQQHAMISSQSYADGIDAILVASSHYGGWDGWTDAVKGATTLPAGVTIDELLGNPDAYRGVAEVDTTVLFRLLDENVVKPVADTAALLYKAPYLTRLYSSMSPDEMMVDPAFNYNPDLAQVSNVHLAKQLIQCKPTLNQDDAPWRIELPQGGVVVGQGRGSWPVAEGSMPANLKVVMLGASGSGTVVEDNSDVIGMKLWKAAGTTGSGMATLHPPQNGLMIGGTQSVALHGDSALPTGSLSASGSTHGGSNPAGGATCSVWHVGAGAGPALALSLPLAGTILAVRGRRRRLLANGYARRQSVAQRAEES
jgi:hypothetical protein